MKSLILVFTLLTSYALFGQTKEYLDAELKDKPTIHELDEKYADEPSVIILDDRHLQFYLNNQYQAYTYYTIHKIIRVNGDAGIEMFNKVYIPLRQGEEIVRLEVRTISPNNETQEFDSSNLKRLTNVEGMGNYAIFAVEGIQKGGEIEYLYTVKKYPQTIGREIYQRDVPIVKANFELICPPSFSFLTQSYNDFPEPSSAKGSKRTTINATDIPALTNEGYSSYRSKLMRVDYKMHGSPRGKNTITWKSISTRLFDRLADSKGSTSANKFIKSLNIKDKSEAEKIMTIEKTIKEQFTTQQGGDEKYEDLNFIFKNKVASGFGIAKAYVKCFALLEIPHQIVLSSSRFDGEIDPDFAHSLDLNDVLFYFPEHKKYISPETVYQRFGPAPNTIGGNLGLFLTGKRVDVTSKLGLDKYTIQRIDKLPASGNNSGITAKVRLNESLDEASVSLTHLYQGHRGYMYRYFLTTGNDEQKESLKTSLFTSAIEDANYTSFELENEDVDLSTDNSKALKIHSEITTKSLIERAGNDILLAIGKVIGKQNEMYEEKKRTTDVILPQCIRYTHNLSVEIPEGYVCKGLDQLDINNVIVVEGETIMRFVCTHTYEDQLLTITINEDYEELELDKSQYNDYRKVVNSAADFNKIILVLEPKG